MCQSPAQQCDGRWLGDDGQAQGQPPCVAAAGVGGCDVELVESGSIELAGLPLNIPVSDSIGDAPWVDSARGYSR